MEEKLNGIVLGGVSYGENDKILSVFTLGEGVISAKIKGVKKAGAKLKFAAEPFCFAEFVFSRRGAFHTVTGASLLDSFYPVREDLTKFFAASAVAEFDRRFLREGIASDELFLLTLNALKQIAYGQENSKSLLIKFLLGGLKNSGYALNLGGCVNCKKGLNGRIYFDYDCGGFLCNECFNGEGREINFSTYESLRRTELGEEIEESAAVKPLRLLDFYISAKAEENLKSLKELLKL